MEEIPAVGQVRVALMERKITYADAARQDQEILARFRPKFAAADQQWAAEMNRARAAERESSNVWAAFASVAVLMVP